MIQRIILELDEREREEFRTLLEKLKSDNSSVEIRLTPYMRSIARTILKDMDRWDSDMKDRW